MEHYSDLYSLPKHVDEQLEDAIPQLPEMEDLDEPPSVEELHDVLVELANRKAPGIDNIPAEILKGNKDVLLPHLHKLLQTCWKEVTFPQDMRDAKIITLYKNKGDKGDCNNYR